MPRAAKKPIEPIVEVFDEVEQGSEEWLQLRLGVLTASRFHAVLADGKDGGESLTRRALLYRLAGERITGEISETFQNEAMRRGSAREPIAREAYTSRTFMDVRQVGFIRRKMTNPLGTDWFVGCSPDALVGTDGALEIKDMRADLVLEMCKKGAAGFPTQHRAQCQGALWVCEPLGVKWIDLQIHCRGFPFDKLPRFRIVPDHAYQARLAAELERFDYELRQLVKEFRE